MKNNIFCTFILITTSSLILENASYGSDRGRATLPKSDQKIIDDAFTKDEKLKERVQIRGEGRDIQKKGKNFKKNVDRFTKPMKSAGTTVGIVASASGDPHAKAAAAAFMLSISAIDALGKGIAQIIIGVGRYQERSQQILSNIEVLVEDVQKSIDKKKSLEKKLQELLDVEKLPEPSQSKEYDLLLMSELPKNGKPDTGKIYLEKVRKNDSTLKDSELKYILMQPDGKVAKGTLNINTPKDLTPEVLSVFKKDILDMIAREGYTISKNPSRLKQFGKGMLNAAKTAQIKVRQATDVLTNEKAKRDEKIKDIQSDLKSENEDYNEAIRLLQIILMQDALKEIDKKINIEDTIERLESSVEVYERTGQNLSKSKSERKKQIADEKKGAQLKNDLIYYMKFRASPTETVQELEEGRSDLINKIKELTQLTKMGESIYLQQREVTLDSQVNKTVIVALYREIDAIKSQLAALSKAITTKAATFPEPVKKDEITSPSKPVSKATSTQGAGLSKEVIRKQRDALRPIPSSPR